MNLTLTDITDAQPLDLAAPDSGLDSLTLTKLTEVKTLKDHNTILDQAATTANEINTPWLMYVGYAAAAFIAYKLFTKK